MDRRRFDHLAVELSVAACEPIARYALWQRLQEHGLDPLDLRRDALLAFVDGPLARFLLEQQLAVPPRALRRLRRRVARFDPAYPTPEEVFARIVDAWRREER